MSVNVRFQTSNGVQVLVESSHAIPLVEVSWTLRIGSERDPKGKEGLTRLWARLLRAGTGSMRSTEVEERLASLGARFSFGVQSSFARFGLVVIERNLEPALQLVSQLFAAPAFRARDLARVRRETLADLTSLSDHDRSLAERQFRAALFPAHAYGRVVLGTRESIKHIRREDVVAMHELACRTGNMVIGAAGAVDPERLSVLLQRYFGDLPSGSVADFGAGPTLSIRGYEVWVVDKPERTQTQILIGTLGTSIHDPGLEPLQVANTVFGGTFTSRLMREVRSVRGWSYGASSRLDLDRHRDAWAMSTFPAAKDAVDCIRLQLELYDAWWEQGIDDDELSFTKSYLTNSYAFDIDTPVKRLHQRLDVELYGLPDDFYSGYLDRVQNTTAVQCREAVQARLSRRDLAIVLVASRRDVETRLQHVPGVTNVHVVPFRRVFE
jgi:zinc protease